MKIEIIRHGPKNIVKNHTTGQEALLSKEGIKQVKEYAKTLDKKTFIYTSPVPRAKYTAESISNVLKGNYIIEPKFSSYDLNGTDVVNLVSSELSKAWGDNRNDPNKEDESLNSWTEFGWNNSYGKEYLSIREIGKRLGRKVLELLESSNNKPILAISHSGDIEPLLALLVNDTNPLQVYKETDGALLPLEGISFEKNGDIVKCTYKDKYKYTFDIEFIRTFVS